LLLIGGRILQRNSSPFQALVCLPRILILLIDEFWMSYWMIDMWTRVYGMIMCGTDLLHNGIIRKVVV